MAPTHVLALGIEPHEALGGGRVTFPLRVDVEFAGGWTPRPESAPYGLGREAWRRVAAGSGSTAAHLPAFDRHDSGRYALLFSQHVDTEVPLRIYDHRRRYVPRRLAIPVPAEDRPVAERVRRPLMFPGAAHHVADSATGLRGRVLRGGAPMRWARVEAVHPDTSQVVGRAHGDDRGEFLLVLESAAQPLAQLAEPLEIEVTVFGPQTAPTPSSPAEPELDAYWDLPLEQVPAPGDPDDVSTGVEPPAGYVGSLTRTVEFRLGRLLTGREEPDFLFS